jgi:competence protein ComEA
MSKIIYTFFILLFFVVTIFAQINLNSASKDELMTLPGIGSVKAQAIIEYRAQYGEFHTLDELINVKGIGKKTIQNIKDKVIIKQ